MTAFEEAVSPPERLLCCGLGFSENQFREMTQAGVHLVVPADLFENFPRPVRPYLQTLDSFIADVQLLP